jgi:hypothetical protein
MTLGQAAALTGRGAPLAGSVLRRVAQNVVLFYVGAVFLGGLAMAAYLTAPT